MNDPNAPIYWNGKYHMFYQYNPDGAYWGNMHWGHAVSPDMVHWQHLPMALGPTANGHDAAGCFTGTALVENGRVLVLYTGVQEAPVEEATAKDSKPPVLESQLMAIAEDSDLTHWQKVERPVIATPPPEFQVNGFRDPSPWRQGEWWYAVVACGVANEGGAILLYRSRDLRAWEYMHVLSRRERRGLAGFDAFNPWEVWECPEFFRLGDWHVLIYSTGGKTYWQSGRLDEQSMIFSPEQSGILDYGSFYAAKTQLDKAGKRVAWGWITETRTVDECKSAGWAGVMSLPRQLDVSENGRLRFAVADEVDQLRKSRQSVTTGGDDESVQRQISELRIAECCGEIRCSVKRENFAFDIALCGTAGDTWLRVGFDPEHPDQVAIDGRPLSLDSRSDNNLDFRMYIDGSVIELFVNGEIAWTKRFYHSGEAPQDLRLQWKGSASSIVKLDIWELSPISTNRLTES